ncbi:MAG: alpha/beta hydrolase [Actinomycetota bacterium]|nr:alpha/beta hydrolase [Actinomycetota bacterium]
MFERINGQHVYTVSFGSGSDVVVGVSGSFGTWEIWQPPFELLSETCRTIAYDHYGTGQTRVPPHLVTFENQVELLGRILSRHATTDGCVLAGDSSMTAVAIAAAHRWPEAVSGLVLVSGGLDFSPTEPVTRFVEGLRHAFGPTVAAFVEMALPEDSEGHLRSWLQDIITRTGGERAAALVESFYSVDIRDLLGDVQMPTVVIHGELDAMPTSSLAAAEELAQSMPNAELLILPDTGHIPTLTRPDDVAQVITRLLRVAHP